MTVQLPAHVALPEPVLAFSADRASDVETHPLRGLLRFGPYSRNFVHGPIRVATISPSSDSERLFAFMRELSRAASARERKDYLLDWPSFHGTFGVHVQAAAAKCQVKLANDLDQAIAESPKPHFVLIDRLTREIQTLQAHRAEFDVLFIYLPTRWSSCFQDVEDDFDLHDFLKAATAMRGVPLQIVREDKALEYADRAAVMWRVGLALYVKAGGVPWKLADADPEHAFIGISYALRPAASVGGRFVTCCSQVFDADGAGLEFVAYDAREVEVYRDNPFLSRTEMFRVMTRAMDLYRRRHAGRAPRRVSVHKSTEFKSDEIAGCMEALHLCESVDLIQVVEDVPWRGVRIEGSRGATKGQAAAYPVERGSLLGLGGRDALIWTHGVSKIVGPKEYFQGGKGTPKPLRLVRHAGHGSWDRSAADVLALTKMNWNNDALYDHLPVTLANAKTLARVVKRMDTLGASPYPFRFFM